jgi:hypothetical protein
MVFITKSELYACSVHNTPPHLLARFDASKAASMLSALGASKGGKARAESLTPEERKGIAKKAANARWSKESS